MGSIISFVIPEKQSVTINVVALSTKISRQLTRLSAENGALALQPMHETISFKGSVLVAHIACYTAFGLQSPPGLGVIQQFCTRPTRISRLHGLANYGLHAYSQRQILVKKLKKASQCCNRRR